MNYETKRDRNGDLKVETKVGLGGDKELRIETSKFNGKLRTRAMVVHRTEHGFTVAIGLAGKGDFYKTLATEEGRATVKRLEAMHTSSFLLDEVVEEAKAYYEANEVVA